MDDNSSPPTGFSNRPSRRSSCIASPSKDDDDHNMFKLKGPHSLVSPKKTPSPLSTSPGSSQMTSIMYEGRIHHSGPRPLPTPSNGPISPLSQREGLTLPPSAPASPPTPAPSPTPHQRAPSWNNASEMEEDSLAPMRKQFQNLDAAARQRYLAEILNMCSSQQLSFVLNYVSPRLKKDPFKYLPSEIKLRVSFYFVFAFSILGHKGSEHFFGLLIYLYPKSSLSSGHYFCHVTEVKLADDTS
jgi:hypothetical protein